MREDIYQFTVKDLNGKKVPLSNYRGKVLLIVNTASECGYTPQFEGLQQLYQIYRGRGFEVLAFPSNDFGEQEPLEGQAIRDFCSKEFGVTFPVLDKIKVKGEDAHPLYQFLSDKTCNGKTNVAPKWNFHKYLVDRNGHVVDYFWTIIKPMSWWVRWKVKRALAKPLSSQS